MELLKKALRFSYLCKMLKRVQHDRERKLKRVQHDKKRMLKRVEHDKMKVRQA
ncbi:MAG: hypothetical protein QXT73_08855 [Candidatus Methanomethylicaceae archaeon]